ncbi:MAG: hypothetical protein LAO19_09920 [Acidobacteriia bacterium]|nr:hypothetical protein [Terriglobia bacterium]
MSKRIVGVIALAVGLLCVSSPALAHHGTSVFDMKNPVTMKASVTEWDWYNPHCLLQFDAKNEGGQVVHWIAETQNPAEMLTLGWAKASFKPGDQVTVTLVPAKNGKPFGRITLVVLSNGKTFITSKEGFSLKESDGPQPDKSSKY